ncbi:hypothetical protein ABES03_22635 [Neobacillus rhizosphaerae]|uniref:hypothetical protein n=1 Tax=Neobacillus rhizosphaerae TaxID=2880965 RepID=UPI003D2DDAF2
MDYKQQWERIFEKKVELHSAYSSYWNQYSDFGNWQFWLVFVLFLFPLILLVFSVDRKRIFELFFFGYTVHILWAYTDIALGNSGFFVHKYFLLPVLPNATNVTASVLPVGFLLVYQYCTNHKKNFFLYTILFSAVFAFGFASIEKYLGLVDFRKGMNQFYLFLIDLVIVFIAFWITKLLLKVRDKVRL